MKTIIIIFIFLAFVTFSHQVFAESSYVLPYPSAMPGSILYKLNLVQEEFLKYWYFGDFGQFKYNLQESDKYLVEAKTLFDYKQYLLGLNALRKSDSYFERILPSLESASKHHKEISEKSAIFKQASQKHIETLGKMKKNVPESFSWQPEKQNSQDLKLWNTLDNSILIRGQ